MKEDTSQKEVFARFGLAAYTAQCLEMTAGSVILAYVRVAGKIENKEIIEAVERRIDRDTLGRLLKEIKKTASLDDKIQEHVDTALSRRNHLTHSFFRMHSESLLTDSGRMQMIEELDSIRHDINKADKMLHMLAVVLLKTLGYTEEQIENYPLENELELGATNQAEKPRA